jgi:hypothetical protein
MENQIETVENEKTEKELIPATPNDEKFFWRLYLSEKFLETLNDEERQKFFDLKQKASKEMKISYSAGIEMFMDNAPKIYPEFNTVFKRDMDKIVNSFTALAIADTYAKVDAANVTWNPNYKNEEKYHRSRKIEIIISHHEGQSNAKVVAKEDITMGEIIFYVKPISKIDLLDDTEERLKFQIWAEMLLKKFPEEPILQTLKDLHPRGTEMLATKLQRNAWAKQNWGRLFIEPRYKFKDTDSKL